LGRIRLLLTAPLLTLLAACQAVVLNPSGDVAQQQRDLLIYSTVLMLIVIVPVMIMTILFAWKYRESNRAARYEPNWDHSIHLELMIWAAPLLIIIGLGGLTWVGTHLLDPYRSLGRVNATQSSANAPRALQVDVVALDWKWLFIYPEYGVATVNEVAAPLDRPIEFRITAATVMNSLFIPTLAGQIYAMPGMETRLNAVANKAGDYAGFSANFSGAGFSDMHFTFHALNAQDFSQWIARLQAGGGALGRSHYAQLAQPSMREPVRGYASVDPELYHAILNRCVEPGQLCIDRMMVMDQMNDGDAGGSDGPHGADATDATDAADRTPERGAGLKPPVWSASPPSLAKPATHPATEH
jgi:cytochrome o ubiquinol oxidase subunit 2